MAVPNPETADRQVVEHEVESRLLSNPELRLVYQKLTRTEQPLSVKFLSGIIPGWEDIVPIKMNGTPSIGYARSDVSLAPVPWPAVIFPDTTSAGGKTSFTRGIVREYPDITTLIHTCTTRPIREEEQKESRPQIISNNPLVEAQVSDQYVHVTRQQFKMLADADFFIEKKPMWADEETTSPGHLYGIPRPFVEDAIKIRKHPFSFLIVDEEGQETAIDWLRKQHIQLKTQKWFILPTELPFSQLMNRIITLRKNEAAARIVDALNDLVGAPLRADIIIPNPEHISGQPVEAIRNAQHLMGILRPALFLKVTEAGNGG